MKTILIHPFASVLSAYGIGLANTRANREDAVGLVLTDGNVKTLHEKARQLEEDAAEDLVQQGFSQSQIRTETIARARYDGTDTLLEVPLAEFDEMQRVVSHAFTDRFGYRISDTPIIVDALYVQAIGEEPDPPMPGAKPQSEALVTSAAKIETSKLFLDGSWQDVPLYQRNSLAPGSDILGPAILVDTMSSIVVEPGWSFRVDTNDMLILEAVETEPDKLTRKGPAKNLDTPDPMQLEIFSNLFMTIAEQMGTMLERTAMSVNIKERLDFSCAVFDTNGALIANAPHMPVHLGSMGDSVTAAIEAFAGEINPGDSFVLNDPYAGGTHLPDITVVLPVFKDGIDTPLFYTAARGHHADIGGMTPGSMPPWSREIEDEGIVFHAMKLTSQGVFHEELLRKHLAHAKHPARNPDQNIADLRAQLAACQTGAAELLKACTTHGVKTVKAYMGFVQDNAESAVREVIDRLSDGSFCTHMDCGADICVSLRIDKASRSAVIDFEGTSEQQDNNFNAPSSVARAAVLYAFRCLIDKDVPLNAGCLRPLEIRIPDGSMLSPNAPAAVVAGNVETSQIITDTVFAACGALAASQGTMNNLTFGNATHQYYETICGGSGAGPDFDGTSGIQTHMTNSRLTDPEILEARYPVLVDSFGLRHGSGGRGVHTGGDGVIRRLTFREPMSVAILSGRRTTAPFGLNGGGNAKAGHTQIERKSGAIEVLRYQDERSVEPGDTIEIQTPGGGGFGEA